MRDGLSDGHAAVLYCGTSKAHPDEKYKLLGLAYCDAQIVDSPLYIAKHRLTSDLFDEWGFRYPKGFRILRAEKFIRPLQSSYDLLGKDFVDGISRIKFGTLFDKEKIQQVMSIERGAILFPTGEGNVDFTQSANAKITRTKRLSGPVYTYIFRFDRWNYKNCFKIGFTNDLNRRFGEFCNHAQSEILQRQWNFPPVWYHKFTSESEARVMESMLLDRLNDLRTIGERIVCRRSTLRTRLNECLKSVGLPPTSGL